MFLSRASISNKEIKGKFYIVFWQVLPEIDKMEYFLIRQFTKKLLKGIVLLPDSSLVGLSRFVKLTIVIE